MKEATRRYHLFEKMFARTRGPVTQNWSHRPKPISSRKKQRGGRDEVTVSTVKACPKSDGVASTVYTAPPVGNYHIFILHAYLLPERQWVEGLHVILNVIFQNWKA